MKRAYVGIRSEPHYRADAFVSGLKAVGYDVRLGPPQTFDAETVYCCWNRYGANHDYCTRMENAGGVCLIAENGYLAHGGISQHGITRTVYALARSFHNDSTRVPDGDADRWNALGIELKPWRADGGHILVAPNRTFGVPGRAMPPEWPGDVAARLRGLTKREVRVRPHPGNDPPRKPLAEDLAGAWATVIWSSSAGVHSLVAGVPVVCESPAWVCKHAAHGPDVIDRVEAWTNMDYLEMRETALARLAWGQFGIDEIADGSAFRVVLTTEGAVA